MPGTPTQPGILIHDGNGPSHIPSAPTSITAFVGVARSGPLNEAVRVLSWTDFVEKFGGIWNASLMSYAVHQYFLNGGSIAIIVRINSDADLPGDRNASTGIYALRKVDTFNLLVISPMDRTAAVDPATVLLPALRFCRDRSAMLVVDAPHNWSNATDAADRMSAGEMSALTDDPAASCAALYFPWIQIADPFDGTTIDIPPAGAVAGIFARTDATRGIWNAPAGTEASLRGTLSLSQLVTDQKQTYLNDLGVNVLREFPNIGRVVWGARTLGSADQRSEEYKYVPIRRLSLFIEASLQRGLQWVVFEPNTDPLWSEIRLRVGAFLHDLFTQGAFRGATAAQAYFVKCDAQTNPPGDGAAGEINVVVGFAALKPAEFIIMSVQLPHRE